MNKAGPTGTALGARGGKKHSARLGGGELNPYPVTAAARWLLNPGGDVPAEIREAFVREIQLTTPTVLVAAISVVTINALCVADHGAAAAWPLLLWNIALSAGRVVVTHMVFERGWKARPVMTDLYVFFILGWCATQGVLSGLCEASNIIVLQVLSANSALALQGPLCARHFKAPRLCRLMILALTLPWAVGAACAHEHWLLTVVIYAPFYLSATFKTIQQFLDDAIALQQARLAASAQARHDPLTGALNRLGAAEAMQRLGGEHCALLCLDLDGFKAVNDSYGHPAGDALLRQVTARLQRLVRAGDSVARLGGDEFLIVAPGMQPAACEAFAARMIREISAPYRVDGVPDLHIGVSVGLACAPEDGVAMEALHAQADAALYEAKQSGKGGWRRGFGRAA